MDPFLLLDVFSTKLPAGFQDHPHRGFEMATYIIKGSMVHEDFHGHKEVLNQGDFSWSSIGRGVVHSEMPTSAKEETVGLLIWSNLPRENKFDEYTYKKYAAKEIPSVGGQGVTVKVLAGEAFKVKSLINAKSEIMILDVDMQDECVFEHVIKKGWNTLCYVYEGNMTIASNCLCCGKQKIAKNNKARLQTSREDRALHIETGKDGARFILIAGKPLDEPVHHQGPFVLATQKDLQDTFEDYRLGINGFEGKDEFHSELGRRRDRK